MKCFVLMLGLIPWLLVNGWAAAATNELQTLTIQSTNGGSFDMAHFRTIYHGPVIVDDPRMHMTSDWLAADLPHDKVTDSHVVAATNVVMRFLDDKGQTNHATSDLAVYNMHVEGGVTNETVTLTGHARMWSDKVIIAGEPLIWDLVKQELTSTNWQTTFTHDMLNSIAGTNSASHKTNNVPRIPGL